jgi:hypothetical protein
MKILTRIWVAAIVFLYLLLPLDIFLRWYQITGTWNDMNSIGTSAGGVIHNDVCTIFALIFALTVPFILTKENK